MNRQQRRANPTPPASNGHKPELAIPPLSLERMRVIVQNQQQALTMEVNACAAALGIPADAGASFDIDNGVVRFPEPVAAPSE